MPLLLSSPEPTTPVKPPGPTPPLPPINPYDHDALFTGLSSMTWTGWDGSTWELWCQQQQSLVTGVALGPRIRGLHFADVDMWTSESPNVDGGAYQGYRVKPREVFLSLRVFKHTNSQEWLDHDRRFWRTMLPVIPGVRGPGRLTVTQPNGAKRWIELYPRHSGDHEYARDPSLFGWCSYGQYLTALNPFWLSEPSPARTFTDVAQGGFHGGSTDGSGPPFVIADAAVTGAAVIDNPGDDYAWPVWTIRGPFTAAKVGVPGQQTEITMTVPAGRSLTINSDPMAQTVTDELGAPVMPTSLAGAPFAPIPPGQNVPLVAEITTTGGGNISAWLQPRHHRAW